MRQCIVRKSFVSCKALCKYSLLCWHTDNDQRETQPEWVGVSPALHQTHLRTVTGIAFPFSAQLIQPLIHTHIGYVEHIQVQTSFWHGHSHLYLLLASVHKKAKRKEDIWLFHKIRYSFQNITLSSFNMVIYNNNNACHPWEGSKSWSILLRF